MARLQRVDPKMGWHHITNHVVGDGDLFLDDEDRHLFLRLLVRAGGWTLVEVTAFSLMGNHFHLMLFCPEGRLSEFMQQVQATYARTFNDRHTRRGPLFVARFHNTVITSDEQALMTSRYIDRNALELGMDIEHYPWSSFPAHVTGTGVHDQVLAATCSLPVRLAGGRAAYREFVCTDGSSDRFRLTAGTRRVACTPYRPVESTLDEFVALAATVTGSRPAELTATTRGVRSGARLATILVAHREIVASLGELAEFFGFAAKSSLVTAINRARRRETTHVEFRAVVAQIESTWHNSTVELAS